MSWRLPLLAFLLLFPTGALPQEVPVAALRKAVAIVVARGTSETDSAPLTSQGSGFFINSMGLLVTSYHLRTNLGATVHDKSVAYEVHFDNFSPAVPATDVYSSAAADILILYVPTGGREVGILKPAGPSSVQLSKTPVYAASYAAGYDFSVTPAVVTSFSGPVKPLVPAWTTNFGFADGQSGSPLVLEDGRVVAIVKGKDASGSIGIVVPVLFIPSQYWDSGGGVVTRLAGLSDKAEPARVVVSKTIVSQEPREVVRTVSLNRTACAPDRSQRIRIGANPGAIIETGSIVYSVRSFVGKSLVQTSISNVTSDGFDFVAEMETYGICLMPLLQGTGARLQAELRYRERPLAPEAREVVLADAAAVPGIQLPLGKSASDLNFSLIGTNGATLAFVPANSELKKVHGQLVLDVARVLATRPN